MSNKSVLGMVGLLLGGSALLVGVLHFWLGPIEPSPSLEQLVADKAAKIRDAVMAGLAGDPLPADERPRRGPDELLVVATVVCGTLAVLFATGSFIRREDLRIAASAAVLGTAAVALQLFAFALGLIVLLLLLYLVVSMLGGAPG